MGLTLFLISRYSCASVCSCTRNIWRWFGLAVLFFWVAPFAAQAEIRSENLWWLPANATTAGEKIDFLFIIIFWVTFLVFVAVQAVMIYFLVRYRARKGVKAVYSHGNNTLEIVWTLIPAVIFLLLWIYSNQLWMEFRMNGAPANALTVEIVGEQFGWHIRYAGADGKLGAASDAQIDPVNNKIGLDKGDPAAQDDIILYNDMVVPVGQPVHLILRSRDVIHAFYVPEFRLFQDMVPGRSIGWVWFNANREGKYAIACSQLCGAGHYNMQGKISVVPQAEYDKWLASQKTLSAASTQVSLNQPR